MGIFANNPKLKLVFSALGLIGVVGVGVGLGVGNHIAFDVYPNVISTHLAPNGDKESASADSARNMGNQLAREIEREGIVLLQNNGTLPL